LLDSKECSFIFKIKNYTKIYITNYQSQSKKFCSSCLELILK